MDEMQSTQHPIREQITDRSIARYRAASISVTTLFVATLAGAALNFGVQALLARVLGREAFGTFAAVLSIVTLLAPLAGFGVSSYWLNAYGREGWAAQRWLRPSLRFICISSVLVLSAVFLWAWLGPHGPLTTTLLMLMAVTISGAAATELVAAKYQLEANYPLVALYQALPHALRFMGVSICLLLPSLVMLTVVHAAIIFMITGIVVLALGTLQIRKMLQGQLALSGHSSNKETINHDVPSTWDVAVNAWPFGMAGVFYLVYFQSDIILVHYLAGETAAGLYNAAFIVIAAAYLLPSTFYQKYLLPKLQRWAYHDPDNLRKSYKVGNAVMAAFGVIAAGTLWLIAPSLTEILFGVDYSASSEIIRVLLVGIPLRYVSLSVGAILATRNHIKIKVKIMGAAALINVVLNIFLIPLYGPLGAAVSTLLAEALTTASYLIVCRKIQFYKHDGN